METKNNLETILGVGVVRICLYMVPSAQLLEPSVVELESTKVCNDVMCAEPSVVELESTKVCNDVI